MGRMAACTCRASDTTTDQQPDVTVLEKGKIHNTEGFSAKLNSLYSPRDLKDKWLLKKDS